MVSARAAASAAALALVASPAAASAPISPREMVEITDLSSLAISPDGRSVAFREERGSVDRNAYVLDWYVTELDGSGSPRRIADAGEGQWQDGVLRSEPPAWSPDSHWIYFRAIRDAQVQLWRAASDGSRAEPITHEAGNVIDFHVDAVSGLVLYRIGPARADIVRAEQEEYDRGIRIDATVDPSRGLFRSDRIDGRAATTRLNGFWFAHGGLLNEAAPIAKMLDPVSLAVRPATPAEAEYLKPKAKSFDRIDGRLFERADSGDRRGSAYIVQTDAPRIQQLAITSRATLAGARLCDKPQCVGQHIVNVAWARTGNRLVFATSAPGIRYALHLWDIDTGTVTMVASAAGTLDGGRDGSAGCAIAQHDAVCVAASADDPPSLVRYDLRTGDTISLADPNSGLRRAGQPRFRAFAWDDAAGRSNTGQLMLPLHPDGPVPLFITYYTCDGYLRGGTGDEYPLRQLANHGVAVLCINRLAMPSLGDQLETYRVAQAGIEAAVKHLADDRLIDPRRVGMGGLSLGGEITLWVAMHTHLLSAISISNILLTPTYYWFNAMKGRETPDVLRAVWGIGPPDAKSARWKALSAFYTPTALQAPLLMQLPEHEMRVVFPLAAKLSRMAAPAELWGFPDEGHIKAQPRHKLAVYDRNLDWFLYWLTGFVDPDPAKSDQYAHWRNFARRPGWLAAKRSELPHSDQLRSQDSTSISGNMR